MKIPLGLALLCSLTAQAGVLPLAHLDAPTIKAFDDYVAAFEKRTAALFATEGKLWIDSAGSKSEYATGSPVVESRENKEVANGSIHHYSGVIRVPGAKIENVRKIMQDFGNYPKYFKPDLSSAEGVRQPDSTPEDEHLHTHIVLTQSTFWMDVIYDSLYDTHYRRLDANRWTVRSNVISIREMVDPKNPSKGFYEGDDHGFLWRTNTYWFVRERDGGLDMQVDSMSLSRKIPMGFGWWGTKRTKDAVDKMLRDTKAAVLSVK